MSIIVKYEIRYDESNEQTGGLQTKVFENANKYYDWLTEQNAHPWLHIHVVSKENSEPDAR